VLLSKIGNIKILGNLIVNNGKVQLGSDNANQSTMEVEGNLSVDSGAVLDLQGSSSPTYLKLKGNATLNGTITESGNSTGTSMEMTGTSTQTITAKGSIEENVSFVINNPAGLNCLTDLKLGGGFAAMLKLQNGNLDVSINDKTIFVRNNLYDAIEGGSLNSHIIGKLSRATAYRNSYSFPLSDNAADLATAVINVSSIDATNWTLAFKRPNANGNVGLPAGINSTSDYIWNINRESQTQAANADSIMFKYATIAGNGIADSSNTKILRWETNQWTSLGGRYDTSGSILSVNNPISSFGTFCLGKLTGSNTAQLISSSASLDNFGDICIGTASTTKSFILTGNYLSAGKVQVGPANGFRFSTSANGPFLDSVAINQTGGKLDSTIIYVVFNPESAGVFNVAIPAGGAGATTIYIAATGKGIDNSTCNSKPFIYPNPNNGAFNINLPLFDNAADRNVVIYDSKGARLFSKKFNQQLMYVNHPFPSKGVYHIKVFDKFGNKLKSGKVNIIR
jgi:hypothetical protein